MVIASVHVERLSLSFGVQFHKAHPALTAIRFGVASSHNQREVLWYCISHYCQCMPGACSLPCLRMTSLIYNSLNSLETHCIILLHADAMHCPVPGCACAWRQSCGCACTVRGTAQCVAWHWQHHACWRLPAAANLISCTA